MNRFVRLAVSAALLAWIAWGTDWQKVSVHFAEMQPGYWLLALATLLTAQVISTLRWRLFAEAWDFRRTVAQYCAYYFIGMYFNLILPTSVGGDVVRAWYLNGGSGRKLASLGSVFLERLSGLMMLLALGCLGVIFSPLEIPPFVSRIVFALAACGLAGILSMPLVARWGILGEKRSRQIRNMVKVAVKSEVLIPTTLLSILVQVSSVTQVWLIGLALHSPAPASFYWILVPLVSLLTMLPISVNGMGVREGATVLLLAPLGVGDDTAKTLAFLWFALQVSASLVGGLVYVLERRSMGRPVLADPQGQGSPDSEEENDNGSVDHNSNQGRAGQFNQAA